MKNLKTRICDILNLTIPIFQAPMCGAVTPKLISEVANFGGLGMIPLGNWDLEQCEKIIDDTLLLTNKSVGVNLILEWDQTKRLEMSLKKGIKVIWFFWGDPSPYIEYIHSYGAKVICTVGCADGRGLAAALALGADGIVLGTRLLVSYESGIHQIYKQKIIESKETSTVYTNIFDKGWPNSFARVISNSTYQIWFDNGKNNSGSRPNENEIIAIYDSKKEVKRYSCNLPATNMQGNLEALALYAGQSSGLIKSENSIYNILDSIVNEAIICIENLQKFSSL